jgi:hypothetical protein
VIDINYFPGYAASSDDDAAAAAAAACHSKALQLAAKVRQRNISFQLRRSRRIPAMAHAGDLQEANNITGLGLDDVGGQGIFNIFCSNDARSCSPTNCARVNSDM